MVINDKNYVKHNVYRVFDTVKEDDGFHCHESFFERKQDAEMFANMLREQGHYSVSVNIWIWDMYIER